MYSSEDLERFYYQYQTEAMAKGISVEQFCSRSNVPYNMFYKWYKDTRNKIVEVKVDGLPNSSPKDLKEDNHSQVQSSTETKPSCVRILVELRMTNGLNSSQKNLNYQELKRLIEKLEGRSMLNVTGLNHFFYLREFTDMRCKHSRVLSIIHEQLHREPNDGDVFTVMSRDRRIVRLFTYDNRSYCLFEKKFVAGHQFMKVERKGNERVYRIEWRDVASQVQHKTAILSTGIA